MLDQLQTGAAQLLSKYLVQDDKRISAASNDLSDSNFQILPYRNLINASILTFLYF